MKDEQETTFEINDIYILNRNIDSLKWEKNLLVEMHKIKVNEMSKLDSEIEALKNKISSIESEKKILSSETFFINNEIITIQVEIDNIQKHVSELDKKEEVI